MVRMDQGRYIKETEWFRLIKEDIVKKQNGENGSRKIHLRKRNGSLKIVIHIGNRMIRMDQGSKIEEKDCLRGMTLETLF